MSESSRTAARADLFWRLLPHLAFPRPRCIFSEPGFLLFVTGRKNPFVDKLFLPEIQDTAAEDLMIRRLHERPPAALLVTNRAFPEFGAAIYGHGLLDRFFLEVSRHYVLARRIGADAGPVPLRHASGGLLFVPQPGRGP